MSASMNSSIDSSNIISRATPPASYRKNPPPREERFTGIRLQRNAAANAPPPAVKSIKGDYLGLSSNHPIIRAVGKQGDENILFADTAAKVNRHNRIVPRILVITDCSICVFECNTSRLKRRILFKNMESLNLSELADTFLLGIMVPEESDLLVVSTRKTEIVTVLVEATKKNTYRDLDVHFSNTFQVRLNPDTYRQVRFVQTQDGISTQITNVGTT